ncbi:hypothetical protein GCM10027089_22460 [Nocardia thraciensis]
MTIPIPTVETGKGLGGGSAHLRDRIPAVSLTNTAAPPEDLRPAVATPPQFPLDPRPRRHADDAPETIEALSDSPSSAPTRPPGETRTPNLLMGSRRVFSSDVAQQ